jgi:hypothetical protein
MGHLQLALLLAGGFATTALGGSAVWEASLPRILSTPVEHHPIAVDAAGYAIVDEEAHSRISKRWLGAKSRTGNMGLWPERTVRFCYETQEGRDKLHERFKAATKLWHAAGLKKDKYKMVEAANPGATCTGHAERAAILVIEYNDEENPAEMYAHAGLPVVDGIDPDYIGPVANLHDKWNPQAGAISIAHEIGHVWGLDHEQQYRGFWSTPYNTWGSEDQATSEAETVFGKHFNCENIMH